MLVVVGFDECKFGDAPRCVLALQQTHSKVQGVSREVLSYLFPQPSWGGGEKTAEGREFKTYKKKEEKGRKRKTERKRGKNRIKEEKKVKRKKIKK